MFLSQDVFIIDILVCDRYLAVIITSSTPDVRNRAALATLAYECVMVLCGQHSSPRSHMEGKGRSHCCLYSSAFLPPLHLSFVHQEHIVPRDIPAAITSSHLSSNIPPFHNRSLETTSTFALLLLQPFYSFD